MLNRIVLIGRLTKDPVLRHTQGNEPIAVASFSLAVDRNFKNKNGDKETDFFDIVAWRHKAYFVVKYFKKGQLVCVEGRLQRETWTSKDEAKRINYKIVTENCYFCDSKKTQDGGSNDTPPVQDDDDLPI